MENLGNKMKRDTEKAKNILKEKMATLGYYSKIAWSALKKPLMGLGVATILSSCGFTKNQAAEGDKDTKENKTEQIVRHKEVPIDQAVKSNDSEYGYSDANEIAETPEEKDDRETEDEYWRIMSGDYTHGDAGTDKANYGKPGEGAPSRLTEEEAEALYRVRSKIGHGMDNVDMDELDREVRSRVSDNSRDISWTKAVKDSGYEK